MTLSLPNKKIVNIKDRCLSFYKASGFDKTISNTFFNHSSSAPSPFTISLLTETVNFIPKTNTVLPHFGKADSHGKKRIVMVGQQSRTLQWWIGYTTTDRVPYSDRCTQKRAEGCVLRNQNRGSVVQEGAGPTYQSAGTSSHKVCHLDICQNVGNVSYTYPRRQDDSLKLFAENGRDKESRSNADLKGNLGVYTWAGDHNYCQTFTRESQLQDRLRISSPDRFHRMGTVPSNIQQDMPITGEKTRNRPVCFKVVKSASKLLLLEAGSQQSWHGCSSTELVSQRVYMHSLHLP